MQSLSCFSLLVLLSLSAAWLGCVLPGVRSLRNGLALTPPMGWSTWNTFECQYTEKELREVAEVLVASGLQAAGYNFLNIDDCWEERTRTADGQLASNSSKFPNGLSAFGSYLHSLNLSFGLYTSSGPYTCQEYPGSWQHEEVDAKTFAGWGADFLKLDCCYQWNTSDRRTAYAAMSQALLRSGRRIVFSCDTDELLLKENNEEYPADWGAAVCNMARIHGDIDDTWTSTMEILTSAENVMHTSQAGYWNDLDMLTVGMGGQSLDEYISQFQLWCVLSSPLIAGNDLRLMTEAVRRILTHGEAIAVNQDRLRRAGNIIRRALDGSSEQWAKPLHSPPADLLQALPQPDFHPLPYHAVVLLNRASHSQSMTLHFTDLFDNQLSPHNYRPVFRAQVRDVWHGQDLGHFTWNITIDDIRPHASRMLTVRLIPPPTPPPPAAAAARDSVETQ